MLNPSPGLEERAVTLTSKGNTVCVQCGKTKEQEFGAHFQAQLPTSTTKKGAQSGEAQLPSPAWLRGRWHTEPSAGAWQAGSPPARHGLL